MCKEETSKPFTRSLFYKSCLKCIQTFLFHKYLNVRKNSCWVLLSSNVVFNYTKALFPSKLHTYTDSQGKKIIFVQKKNPPEICWNNRQMITVQFGPARQPEVHLTPITASSNKNTRPNRKFCHLNSASATNNISDELSKPC